MLTFFIAQSAWGFFIGFVASQCQFKAIDTFLLSMTGSILISMIMLG